MRKTAWGKGLGIQRLACHSTQTHSGNSLVLLYNFSRPWTRKNLSLHLALLQCADSRWDCGIPDPFLWIISFAQLEFLKILYDSIFLMLILGLSARSYRGFGGGELLPFPRVSYCYTLTRRIGRREEICESSTQCLTLLYWLRIETTLATRSDSLGLQRILIANVLPLE